MSSSEKAIELVVSAKAALKRGDHELALKELSVSISLSPTVEAYFLKAEANAMASDFDQAMNDLMAAKNLCVEEIDLDLWKEKLEKAYSDYGEQAAFLEGPPIAEIISVLLVTPFTSKEELIKKLMTCPFISTDGETMVRKGKSVLYDLEVLDANRNWLDAIVAMSDGGLGVETEKKVARSQIILHVTGPNPNVGQTTKSQIDLAVQFAGTVNVLLYTLGAHCAVLRGSNSVVTLKTIKDVIEHLSVDTLVSFFVKLLVDDECVFSTGLHQLGFPDVELPLSLMPMEEALETVIEFMNFQVENRMQSVSGQIEYETLKDGVVYLLSRELEERFNVQGEARYNQFGLWRFVKRVGA